MLFCAVSIFQITSHYSLMRYKLFSIYFRIGLFQEATFNYPLEPFVNNDLDDLMKDYMEGSEVWTPNGAFTYLQAIAFFNMYLH